MIHKYLNAVVWIAKFQWRLSRFYFGWQTFEAIYRGLSPIVAAYVLAQLITVVGQIAFGQEGVNPETAYLQLLILFSLAIIDGVVTNIAALMDYKLSGKMSIAGKELLISKMYALNQEQFEDQSFNIKFERAGRGADELSSIASGISKIATQLITVVGALIAILVIAPLWIGGLFVAFTAVAILIKIKINNLRDTMFQEVAPIDRRSWYSELILINPKNMAEIRLMNAFTDMIKHWRKSKDESLELEYARRKKNSFLESTTQGIQPLLEFIINIYFLRLLINGVLGLDSFIFLRGLLGTTTANLTGFIIWSSHLHRFSLDWQHFDEFLKTPPAIPIGEIDIRPPLVIEFQNVSFKYPGTDKLILKDVSFKINPGEKLALVGENGSGKTTIVRLIMRQYLPSGGVIRVNGVNIEDINPDNYYAAISGLSQEFLLIDHLTIRENLTIGAKNELSDKDISRAISSADATAFVEALPEKLESRLDPSFENGTDLSSGQRQRLSIARALIRSADMMILDEPTSAIDAKAEYRIFSNLYDYHADKATLIISHRFNTVRQADTIIVLDKGRIVEQGSHSKLLNNNGLYKEMFETQAEGYK